MATRKFVCPNCKYRFLADPESMRTSGTVFVVRLIGHQPDNPRGTTVDLTCPNCEKDFEVTVNA